MWQLNNTTQTQDSLSHLLERTGSLWAWKVWTLFRLACQYLTKPLSSVDVIHTPLWLHVMLRTEQSWPCVTGGGVTVVAMETRVGWAYLQNGFKVEIDSIPEGKFSAGRPSDQSPPIWNPLKWQVYNFKWQQLDICHLSNRDAVYGTAWLISSSTDKFGSHWMHWAILQTTR